MCRPLWHGAPALARRAGTARARRLPRRVDSSRTGGAWPRRSSRLGKDAAMATTTATRTAVPLLTYADLDFIPEDREGDRQRLCDGVLVVTPPPAPPHQRPSGRFVHWRGGSAEADDLGKVVSAPVDIVLSPRIVTVPDIVLIRSASQGIIVPLAIENGSRPDRRGAIALDPSPRSGSQEGALRTLRRPRPPDVRSQVTRCDGVRAAPRSRRLPRPDKRNRPRCQRPDARHRLRRPLSGL